MSALVLRNAVHRGSVVASGLVLDTDVVPEMTARERLLGLAALGIDVYRFERLLIAILREPRRLDSSTALGAPLVRYGRLLSAAPLTPDESAELQSHEEAIVLVGAGTANSVRRADLVREDLSRWLDLSAFESIAEVRSLGSVAAKPKAAASPAIADVREALGVPAMDDAAKELLASLSRRGKTPGRARGERALGAAIAAWFSSAWQLLKPARRPASTSSGSTAKNNALAVVPAEPSVSWFSRLTGMLQHFLAQALLWSRLAPLVGRRQAAYLRRMLEMFDSNQLDDALRHAIPLGSELESALKPPALWTPSPRTRLDIVPARAAATSVLGLGENLFEELRRRYRAAFERLAAAGAIEKAAFVLAELLHADEEAVSFLERHGRLKLAAEVAEARKLPPGLVIRQWFLAGERGRALQIAHRTGAFADAVLRLERSQKTEEAAALRLLWADRLASAGAYAGAVDAVWPVERARELALTWLDKAIAVGGPTAARMLPRKLRALPDSFADVRDRVLELLRLEGESARAILNALGHELISGETTAETRVLARAAARRLIREPANKELERVVERLLDASGDAALRADFRARNSFTQRETNRSLVRVSASGLTHAGSTREVNEDFCFVARVDPSPPSSWSFDDCAVPEAALVCGVLDGSGSGWSDARDDGVGRMAADAITSSLRAAYRKHAADGGQWARCLALALEQANQLVYTEGTTDPRRRGIGACATVAALHGNELFLAQVGDTRGYVLRHRTLTQVTRDHTLLNHYIDTMAAQGTPMSLDQIDAFEHKNVITRALGVSEKVEVDVTRAELQRDDTILLCSNGLSDALSDAVLCSTMLETTTVGDICSLLRAKALEAGAPDDLAIVVMRVKGERLPPRQLGPLVHAPFVPPSADARKLEHDQELRSRPTPLEHRWTLADSGSLEVTDAAELPDGRLLVALGELGAALVAPSGKVSARFSEPAHCIVLSDHGDRALLLARRGEAYRVSRLDLLAKRIQSWCDARFDQFADGFDGSTWFVSRRGALYAIDAIADGWEQTWSVSEPDATFSSIRCNSVRVSAWLRTSDGRDQVWTIELPSLTLRLRAPIDHGAASLENGAVSANGEFAGLFVTTGGECKLRALQHGAWTESPLAISTLPTQPLFDGGWLALPLVSRDSTVLHLLDASALHERARLEFAGAGLSVGARIQGERLLAWDGLGRVVALSLLTGNVINEWRIS